MKLFLSRNWRNAIAVIAIGVAGLASTWIILQNQRLRIPILEEKPFELKAEFQTAQAVVPGQGQTIRVAGIRIGDVSGVELDQGKAVVTFAINRDYLPIYRDATVLMRPATELKDMFFELDPGSKPAGEYSEGATIPEANTEPDINLDQVLAELDSDTRAYVRTLLVSGGEGLRGRGKDLGNVFANLGPLNRELAKLDSQAAAKRADLAQLVHNLHLLAGEVGGQDHALSRLVDSSSSALGAVAQQSPDLSRATAALPGALGKTHQALDALAGFADQLGPTAKSLRPFARRTGAVSGALNRLAKDATPAIQSQIRPFVRTARQPVRDLGVAAHNYVASIPRLNSIVDSVNGVANEAAYNPRGREPAGTPGRDEGYLYWIAWLAQHGETIFGAQDANGLFRRIYLTASCSNAAEILSTGPFQALVDPIAQLFQSGGVCN